MIDMSKRSKKIGKIVQLATSEERRHGEQAGRSQQQYNEQMRMLDELHTFRRGYQKKNLVSSGVAAVHLQDYQSFLRRMDRAVLSQQQIVRESERNLEAHRQRWMVKRQKLESLERVLENCRQQDAAYAAKLEQKQLDELSNNSYSTRRNPDN